MAKPRSKSSSIERYAVQLREPQDRSSPGAASDSHLTSGEAIATQANVAADQPPLPSRSTAIWLCVTLLNLVLIVFLIPDSLLKNQRVEFIVKAVPVATGLFIAGYVWIKALFLDFLTHRSYKIAQTAILTIVILLHASQWPIVMINPQLEPADAFLGVDGSEPAPYDGGGFRVSVNDHTVKLVKTTSKQETIERSIPISYQQILRAILRNYNPRWPLLYPVAVDIQQPGVEVRIKKTDGYFDEYFRSKKHFSSRNLPLELDPNSGDTLIYQSGNDQIVPDDVLELPYGDYLVKATRVGCKNSYEPIELSIGKGSDLKYLISYPPCKAEN